ncbi:putative G-protein coupled receptor CG31760 [Stylophora pistillata]|uniref:Putative G-protein coupled receptor CG31760 n=1 Tax=Stylophora pistillata TaxID=50429 RepID=A0A2B4S8R8_STYPI|nr:putative G-protein coupled receptor CG31760 [Stylophora pistillata]
MISFRVALLVTIALYQIASDDFWSQCRCCATAEQETVAEKDEVKRKTKSAVEIALRKVAGVEQQLQERNGQCDKVDLLNITFDERRWKQEALLTVQVANLMTSLWRSRGKDGNPIAANDVLLYHYVRSIVLFSPSVFGSVICFDNYLYKNYTRFCPFAFRDPELNKSVHVIDIVADNEGYDYTTDKNAVWWHKPKNKALGFRPKSITSYYEVRYNLTHTQKLKKKVFPHVTFEDGAWTRPYFDCFGGKVWMVTYLAPFYNETDDFLGVVSIDVVLSDIDINQCDERESSGSDEGDGNGLGYASGNLVEFMGTHLCKKSTECHAIKNQGLKRGSYICTCKRGFYFPDSQASVKVFNGTLIELEHDRHLRGDPNSYDEDFECIPCSVGCDECVDDRPCVYSSNIYIRLTLFALNALVICVAVVFAVYVCIHWKERLIVSYFEPTTLRCIARPWLRHIGFVLVYGSLALKTWRVALIFRVRSAQKLALSDGVLLRRLGLLVLLYSAYLSVWSAMAPPDIEVVRTSDDLKYTRCVENWFNFTIVFAGDIAVLIWGMWLCYKIRNAPAAYNESKYISWAIYNAMFVTSFLMVVRITTKRTTNPDMMYALDFVLIHMDCSTVLILMFIHKFLLLRQMQRSVNNTVPSNNNNILVPDDEIVVKRMPPNQEDLLIKENQVLKDEMRRLSEKLAVLQSRLMTDDNHPIDNITSGRRQSAFTIPTTDTRKDLKDKRLSLQLPPSQLPNCERDKEKFPQNLTPEVIENQCVSFSPQELNPASSSSSSLHSVSGKRREVSQQNLTP